MNNPLMTSEASGRITAAEPTARTLFALDEVKMSGSEIERLCVGVWLMGYAEAIGDVRDLEGPLPKFTPLMEKWGIE